MSTEAYPVTPIVTVSDNYSVHVAHADTMCDWCEPVAFNNDAIAIIREKGVKWDNYACAVHLLRYFPPTVSLVKSYGPAQPVSEGELFTRQSRQELRHRLARNDMDALALDFRRQTVYGLRSVMARGAEYGK